MVLTIYGPRINHGRLHSGHNDRIKQIKQKDSARPSRQIANNSTLLLRDIKTDIARSRCKHKWWRIASPKRRISPSASRFIIVVSLNQGVSAIKVEVRIRISTTIRGRTMEPLAVRKWSVISKESRDQSRRE